MPASSNFKIIFQLLQLYGRVLTDLLFPRACEGCEKPMDHENRGYLCPSCFAKIRFLSEEVCQGCANEFPGAFLTQETRQPWFCSNCSSEKRAYDTCHAVCVYDGMMKGLLQGFKFKKKDYLTRTLQGIFLQRGLARIKGMDFDCMIPVPLHLRKLKERGYNQSLVLASAIAKKTGIPLRTRNLRRHKYSAGQTLQDKHSRLENIRGSFKVSRPEVINRKKILLVDDVLTTGATIQECAKVLKSAGAARVTVLTLARSL